MMSIRSVICGIILLVVMFSGCMAPVWDQQPGINETVGTPFGDVVITTPIPSFHGEVPIFTVTGSQSSETKPTTEIQTSGQWEGFPICFNATEEWSIQEIRNYTGNAHVVTRDFTNFGNDRACNITHVAAMGVGLGINRTPGTREYASAVIINSIWKGTPHIRADRHTLNLTATVGIVPIRTILEDLSTNNSIGKLDKSMFPLVIDQIEQGYFHRSRSGPCGNTGMWEPAWILSGTSANGTAISLWVWAADQRDIQVLFDTPQPFPAVPGIVTYTGEGVQFSSSATSIHLPTDDKRALSALDMVEPRTRSPFWVLRMNRYPSLPSTIMVYRDVTRVNEDTAWGIAHSLGMKGEMEIVSVEQESLPKVYWVREENRELMVEQGYIHYHVLNRPNGLLDEVNLTPTEDEALVRARDFLLETGLFENDTIQDTFIGNSGGSSNTIVDIRYQTIAVMFYRTMNGNRVFANSIRVEVGGNGDIVEVTKRWNEYQPVREYPLITPEEAYQHLLKSDMIDGFAMSLGNLYMKKRCERCENEEIGPLLVHITNISLGYYGRDTMKSGLLRPAYDFDYEFILEGDRIPAGFYVPAVPELGVFDVWNYQVPA